MTDERQPQFGDVLKLKKPGWEGVPDVETPFYFGAKDGLFAHRRLLFGRGAVKVNFWPDNFPEFGSQGKFDWRAPAIPARIMSQVVDFFRRIYVAQKTECMVLLTMNLKTKEWDVFIPTQLVSHGGINYVYDPSHIRRGYIVVGSIHSHCDFNPFHSGTDTGDAADFDGFHATIGFVMKDVPGIVAMVAMNKAFMHYRSDEFPTLFDYSELGQHIAPDWWDDYVGPASGADKPIGYELYKKFEKPTVVTPEKRQNAVAVYNPQQGNMGKAQHGLQVLPPWHAAANRATDTAFARAMMDDWGLDRELDVITTDHNWWRGLDPKKLKEWGYIWDNKEATYVWVGDHAEPSRDSTKFNARATNPTWGKDGELILPKPKTANANTLSLGLDAFWESSLDDKVVDAIVDSQCFTEEDADWAVDFPVDAGDVTIWQEIFMTKAMGAINALQAMGLDVSMTLKTKTDKGDTKEWLLPLTEDQKGTTSDNIR